MREPKAIRILRFDQKYMIALDLAVIKWTCSESKKVIVRNRNLNIKYIYKCRVFLILFWTKTTLGSEFQKMFIIIDR